MRFNNVSVLSLTSPNALLQLPHNNPLTSPVSWLWSTFNVLVSSAWCVAHPAHL